MSTFFYILLISLLISTISSIRSNEFMTTELREYSNLRFECYYNDQNDLDYYSVNGGLLKYVETIKNAIFDSYEAISADLNISSTYFGAISHFDICGVFNEAIPTNDNNDRAALHHNDESICYPDHLNKNQIDADYIAIAYFGVISSSTVTVNEFITYLMNIMQSDDFIDELNENMMFNNASTSSSSSSFRAVDIQIIDANTETVEDVEDVNEIGDEEPATTNKPLTTDMISSQEDEKVFLFLTTELLLIAVGCIFGMCIIITCAFFCFCRKQKTKQKQKNFVYDTPPSKILNGADFVNEGDDGFARPRGQSYRLSVYGKAENHKLNREEGSNEDSTSNENGTRNDVQLAIGGKKQNKEKEKHVREISDWTLM